MNRIFPLLLTLALFVLGLTSLFWKATPHAAQADVAQANVGTSKPATTDKPVPVTHLKVPQGFEVTEFADDTHAHSIYRLAFDAEGRLLAAGRGYLKYLLDTNANGRCDNVVDFSTTPKDGAMGLLWEGRTLWTSGDGGLRKFTDQNNDLQADGPSEKIYSFKTGSEHALHDIKRGPDGWLYLLAGNHSNVDKSFVQSPYSPINDPIAATVLRFSNDFHTREIVADGLRNAYGMDFNSKGELFLYDSDNERCVSLPWYEPTRLYHVTAGAHFGWESPQRADTWRMPAHFPDTSQPVTTAHRGSPTGVVCYRSTQFPTKYQDGLFYLDWTFGKIYFTQPKIAGSTYQGQAEVFALPRGDNGFAPTDAVVHPKTGDLYISVGGRGTRGGVYRIRYLPHWEKSDTHSFPSQPLAKKSLEWNFRDQSAYEKQAQGKDLFQARQALEWFYRFRKNLPAKLLHQMMRPDTTDRPLRHIMADLTASLMVEKHSTPTLADPAKNPSAFLTLALGVVNSNNPSLLANKLSIAYEKGSSAQEKVVAVRCMQRYVGGLMPPKSKGTTWEGYTRNIPKHTVQLDTQRVFKTFPTQDRNLNWEIARLMAMLNTPYEKGGSALTQQLTDKSNPIDDIHFLLCLAQLTGRPPADDRTAIANALISLDDKLETSGAKRDRHWPTRIRTLTKKLMENDDQFQTALMKHPEFGRPDHMVFVTGSSDRRQQMAQLFLQRVQKNSNYTWTPGLVELLARLPADQVMPLFRKQWKQRGLRPALVRALARDPQPNDADKFLFGLNSLDPKTVKQSLAALEKLPTPKPEAENIQPIVQALRQCQASKKLKPLAQQLSNYLASVTKAKPTPNEWKDWQEWLTPKYPEMMAALDRVDGVDLNQWKTRVEKLDWKVGDKDRGKKVFSQTGCVQCHSGPRALGPALDGVGKRFNHDDLLTAMVQPSRDIGDRYRTTLLATEDGDVYLGMIVYEAADGLLLQTGPDKIVRIRADQIIERQKGTRSLMPAGLLDKLTDQQLADLFAYLKSLGP